MKVLFTYNYGETAFQMISELGYEVIYKSEKTLTDTDLVGVDVLVCYDPFRRLSATAYRDLSYIILSSTGINQLPEAVVASNIKVTHNRYGYATPIAEWIVMMLLVGHKQLSALIEQHQNKNWQIRTDLLEMTGRRIVFLGTGNIASQAVKRLTPFDVEIIGVNRSGRSVDGFAAIYPLSELENVLATADAVVVCLPQTAETEKLVATAALSAMKDDAIFINISRGSVVDETALLAALQAGKFSFCALDVVRQEPLDSASPLWNFPQLLITPHNSWLSEKRNNRRLDYIVENLRCIKNGRPLLYVANKKRGY